MPLIPILDSNTWEMDPNAVGVKMMSPWHHWMWGWWCMMCVMRKASTDLCWLNHVDQASSKVKGH